MATIKRKRSKNNFSDHKLLRVNDLVDPIKKDDPRFCKTVDQSLRSFDFLAANHLKESGAFGPYKV